MPRAVLKAIYSYSSEDPSFPASNLLKNQKWKSQGVGQEDEHVTIELEKATKISAIDVGNESSMIITISVARKGQEMSLDRYQEILLSSTFMTPADSRSLENTNRVRHFGKKDLVEEVAVEKWNFVRIVCSQPLNLYTQYGLSFITIHSPEEEEVGESVNRFGNFTLRPESPEVDDRGALFNKWKQSSNDLPSSSSTSPALAIRKATKEMLANPQKPDSSGEASSSSRVDENNVPAAPAAKKPDPPRRNRIIYDSESSDEDSTKPTVAKKPKTNEEVPKAAAPTSPPKRISYQPFGKLLNGVIYTISGIQNPERGTLRQKATEMGARYKPDWDANCTHLICAFKNTPKYNQVRGLGKIVQKNWIVDSYTKRIRFPWRRYALDRGDRDECESEDEVHDDARRPSDQSSSNTRNRIVDSGSDTEDEIQKIQAEKAVPEQSVYDRTTDDEGNS